MFFTADQKQRSRRGRKAQKNKKRKLSLKNEEYNLDSEIQKLYEDAVENFDENSLLLVSC